MGRTQHGQPAGQTITSVRRQPCGDSAHAGKGRHQQQGVRQRRPIAVLSADRLGEPAQLPSRPARRLDPPAVAPVDPDSPQGCVMLARHTPARPFRPATWTSSTSEKPAAAKRARTQVMPGAKAAPTTTVILSPRASGPSSNNAVTSETASEHEMTGRPAATSRAASPTWVPAGCGQDDRVRVDDRVIGTVLGARHGAERTPPPRRPGPSVDRAARPRSTPSVDATSWRATRGADRAEADAGDAAHRPTALSV